jgi:hypothetical protein
MRTITPVSGELSGRARAGTGNGACAGGGSAPVPHRIAEHTPNP